MIRKMSIADVPQIAELEKLCFSDPWSEASVASELENSLSLWLVWEEQGEVLGYIGSQAVLPEADVMNLAVAPKGRRRGIAKALLTELTGLLHKAGVEMLFLEVRASNAPAITLYEGFGFISVGRRPKYYVNPTEDALILRKELGKC